MNTPRHSVSVTLKLSKKGVIPHLMRSSFKRASEISYRWYWQEMPDRSPAWQIMMITAPYFHPF